MLDKFGKDFTPSNLRVAFEKLLEFVEGLPAAEQESIKESKAF